MSNSKQSSRVAELTQLAEDVVQRAMRRGVDVAEAIARSGSELTTRVRLGKPEVVEEASHRGIGMRVIKNKRVALTSTSDLSPKGIDRFVQDAIDLVEISQEDPFAGPADPSQIAHGPFAELQLFDPSLSEIQASQAIELARRAEDAARKADARITNSDGATFSRTNGGFAMVLSGGFRGGYEGSFASLSATCVADDTEGKKRRGYYYSAKRHFAELLSPEAIGIEAAKRTVRKLGAKKVRTCQAPVVFDPDAARSMLGLLASCIVGTSIWKKSSYLAGREGTAVASELVTIIDDPLIARGPGSRPFDGEGLASIRQTVVEQGILKTYLCDSYSARKLNRTSTASASRGASGGVGPSTSNFILQPSHVSPDEILQSTPTGLYVTEMMGFGFNPVTGDFSRGAAGFWIENGKFVHPVSEVTISLNIDALCKSIDAVGSDLDLRTAIASPTFRVANMTIAGS